MKAKKLISGERTLVKFKGKKLVINTETLPYCFNEFKPCVINITDWVTGENDVCGMAETFRGLDHVAIKWEAYCPSRIIFSIISDKTTDDEVFFDQYIIKLSELNRLKRDKKND